jgi:tripartite-type tricarboxylate transporter receptor subunit TctC
VVEGGGPAMSAQVWYGMVAPSRTPREIIQRLYTDIDQIVKVPATRDRMLQNDFEPALMNPQEFGAFIKSEIAVWAKVVKAAGIKAD